MKTERVGMVGMLAVTTIIAGSGLLLLPKVTEAQSRGNNAIFTGATIGASSAFIDASAFGNTSTKPTFCSIIYTILTGSYPVASGAVIDARGLNSSNSNPTCALGESPWGTGSNYKAYPSVILLPAGTITIFYTWVLPNNTKLVGQGASMPVTTGNQSGTVIAAGTALTGPGVSGYSTSMIQFGDSICTGSGVCFRISIEDITLNGSGEAIDGILNLNSQELTYARRVNLYGLTGIGLHIGDSTYSNQAQNSGPYEQIYYSSQSGSGNCAQIYGTGTRGIHGITCLASGNAGGAILLDSSGNSIEDAYVNGFADGILIGAHGTSLSRAWGNVLFNINGGSSVTNLIHLCSAAISTNCPTGSTNVLPRDTSILGATSGNSSGFSIDDEVTGAILSDANVGMYALGEPMAGGNSRFTTSTNFPSWFIGSNAISGTPACQSGSIYSNSGSGSTIWACASGLWGTPLH